MPKVLRRQRAGNKCECLYPSVCWGGRGDFMFHSLPQAFVIDPGIMEKSVHFASVDDKAVLLDLSPSTVWLTTSEPIGELFGDKRSIFLPTSEYSILWTCFLHSTTRQWILFGESGAVVDRCVEDPVLVKIQRQRWRNVWLYPRMYIWF